MVQSQTGARKRKSVMNRATAKKEKVYYDYNLLIIVILLICFGLVMLYSTSAYVAQLTQGDEMFYLRKQGLISVVCILGAFLISRVVDYHWFGKLSLLAYIVANILLVAVKFLGREINGATRWFYIGPVSFQPAELAKIAIIIFIPHLIVKMGRNMRGIKGPCIIFCAGAVSAVFTLFFTNNLSTAIILLGITAIMIFIAHPKTLPFVGIAAAGAGGVLVFLKYLINNIDSGGSFRINRILVWQEPEQHLQEGGWQVMQALYAIGSGGFFGKGLGNSAQKLGAVPEAQNDMIFSIICEELGVFGAGIVTLLFVYLLYRLLFIARNAPDLYGSLMVTGIFAHIALQVILNIAVVINLIPTTGITLPFISYGGTSVMFLMCEITLALCVSRQIQFKGKEEEQEEY